MTSRPRHWLLTRQPSSMSRGASGPFSGQRGLLKQLGKPTWRRDTTDSSSCSSTPSPRGRSSRRRRLLRGSEAVRRQVADNDVVVGVYLEVLGARQLNVGGLPSLSGVEDGKAGSG